MELRETDCIVIGRNDYNLLLERLAMLRNIALSAVALRINVEGGFHPTLDALIRDLDAYQKRFGGIIAP